MRILIFDNDKILCKEIHKIISDYYNKKNIDYQIEVYCTEYSTLGLDLSQEIVKKTGIASDIREFHFKEGIRKISLNQIIVIESNLHDLQFTISTQSKNVKYTMTGKLNDIQEILKDKNFIRIHQSYLVNLKFIKDVSYHHVILKNGEQLPVARPKFREIKEQFLLYDAEI